MSLRDELRKSILSSNQFKSKVIEVRGVKIEVRQPSVASWEKIRIESKGDQLKQCISWAINYCYIPGTTEKVFEDSDFDTLGESPVSGYLDKITDTIMDLIDVSVDTAKKT